MIKQILISVVLLIMAAAFTGCASEKVYGLGAPGLTKEDVNRRHYNNAQMGLWQFQDDLDAFFMIDRPGRRSRLVIR